VSGQRDKRRWLLRLLKELIEAYLVSFCDAFQLRWLR
jgi:hypothetical protein